MADPERDRTLSDTPPQPLWRRRWAWLGLGFGLLAATAAALISPLPQQQDTSSPSGSEAAAFLRGDVEPSASVPVEPTDKRLPSGGAAEPEQRLVAAYLALAEGRGREAFEQAASLVRDVPQFALAQLLYADLLAARAGRPTAFGTAALGAPNPQELRRQGLQLEAQRRVAAWRDPPPASRVPAAFVRLAPSIRHAVAVDTSRSRLYLFSHGPGGLKLVRDVYVSLGKQGVDKRAEGDRRTPLGIYWISAAVPKERLEDRFGHGALRFNYPNAADRMEGRSGSGLFLHGVPGHTLNLEPWTTDGCVAMANADIERLLQTLDASATPVLIAEAIDWVAPEVALRAATEFEPAWQAWSLARQAALPAEASTWYIPGAARSPGWMPLPQAGSELSLVAWNKAGRPMMIVTARASEAAGTDATTYRQYWTRSGDQWRIAFEGPVPPSVDLTVSRPTTGPRYRDSTTARTSNGV